MALRQIAIQGGTPTMHLDRDCVRFGADAPVVIAQGAIELLDGTIAMDVCVSGERSFPGVAWRMRDDAYESFFLRPHQVGNDDAVQYTPVFNGVSGWQLYHGRGHWAPVEFPIGRWFTMRVCFAGDRAEAFLDDMTAPALEFARLRAPVVAGGIGILPGGGVLVARFAYDPMPPTLKGAQPIREEMTPGTVPGWWISNLVPEGASASAAGNWAYLESEPSGLANLARIHPVGNRLNTVFARTTLRAESAGVRRLELGFSDRAVVYFNDRPLFAGRDDYRSRDYRFLGSIGWWDTVFLPLEAGDNELVITVSETFGGWGVQARLSDPAGVTFPGRP